MLYPKKREAAAIPTWSGRIGSPNDWQAAFGGSAWRRVESPGGRVEWCLHLFASEQPDLNWRNPASLTVPAVPG